MVSNVRKRSQPGDIYAHMLSMEHDNACTKKIPKVKPFIPIYAVADDVPDIVQELTNVYNQTVVYLPV